MFDRGLEQLLFSLGQLFLLLVRFPNSQLELRSEYKRLTAEQCCVFCNNLCLYSQYYLQSQRIFLLCLLALGGLLILGRESCYYDLASTQHSVTPECDL